MKRSYKYIKCSCGSPEHYVHLALDRELMQKEWGGDEIIMYFTINSGGWDYRFSLWTRIKIGLGIIWKCINKEVPIENEVTLGKKEIEELIQELQSCQKEINNSENS